MVRAAAASSSAANNRGGGRPVDALRGTLGEDEVRNGELVLKPRFSSRFGEKYGDDQFYCAYHGTWHDTSSFSITIRSLSNTQFSANTQLNTT